MAHGVRTELLKILNKIEKRILNGEKDHSSDSSGISSNDNSKPASPRYQTRAIKPSALTASLLGVTEIINRPDTQLSKVDKHTK